MKVLSASLLAILLMGLVGCAGSTTRESAGEYIDDVFKALHDERSLASIARQIELLR